MSKGLKVFTKNIEKTAKVDFGVTNALATDIHGRIQTVNEFPESIIGNFVEPHDPETNGVVGVFGLKLYAKKRFKDQLVFQVKTDGQDVYVATNKGIYRMTMGLDPVWFSEGVEISSTYGGYNDFVISNNGDIYAITRNELTKINSEDGSKISSGVFNNGVYEYSTDVAQLGKTSSENNATQFTTINAMHIDNDGFIVVITNKTLVKIDPKDDSVVFNKPSTYATKLSLVDTDSGYVVSGPSFIRLFDKTSGNQIGEVTYSSTIGPAFMLNGEIAYADFRAKTIKTISLSGLVASTETVTNTHSVDLPLPRETLRSTGTHLFFTDGFKDYAAKELTSMDVDTLKPKYTLSLSDVNVAIWKLHANNYGQLFVTDKDSVSMLSTELQIKGYQAV